MIRESWTRNDVNKEGAFLLSLTLISKNERRKLRDAIHVCRSECIRSTMLCVVLVVVYEFESTKKLTEKDEKNSKEAHLIHSFHPCSLFWEGLLSSFCEASCCCLNWCTASCCAFQSSLQQSFLLLLFNLKWKTHENTLLPFPPSLSEEEETTFSSEQNLKERCNSSSEVLSVF
jgi:hypothetical protein